MVKDKILGSIVGAALGDAMGAITETRSAERIKEDFGGYIEELITPPDDCFAHGYETGTVTDDFSLAYFTAIELVKSKGNVTDEVAKQAVLTWSEYPEFFHFAGPTTEAAVRRMKGIDVPAQKAADGEVETIDRSYVAAENTKATNGSAMKIFAVGLINPGNLDKAVEDTVTICMPTHPNNASIAGAAAISAAVAKAMEENATLDDVIAAGIYGAEKGFEEGSKKGHRLAVPSVAKRIKLAVEIGKKGLGWEESMIELRDIIGAGLMVVEAVPCVFGILAANPDDPFGAIKMGVNIGDDTDTVATMVGAVAGALYGTGNMPMKYLEVMDRVNHFDLEKLADDIEREFYAD